MRFLTPCHVRNIPYIILSSWIVRVVRFIKTPFLKVLENGGVEYHTGFNQ